MISRILVALDGSERAPGVFAAAVELGARFRATLHPFRAVVLPPEFPAAAAGSRPDPLGAHLLERAEDELAKIASSAPPGLHVLAPIVRFGQPWRLILAVSDELDADLIVLGSHGYHALDRVLGTTAARVANVAHRNVLVVHARSSTAERSVVPAGPYRQTSR